MAHSLSFLIFALCIVLGSAYPFYDGASQCSTYSSQFQEGTGPFSNGVSTTSCTPGTLASATDGLYLGALNMFRSFAGLSSVSSNPAQDNATQACALICQANNNIQHSWSASATCYTTLGNNGCGSSNLLGGGGTVTPADAISDWVNDMNNVDNPNNLGHRLWCLSPTLGGVSMGITTNYASLYVFGTQSAAAPAYVAWPPPGITPIAAIGSGSNLQNFLFHYASSNFSRAAPSSISTCQVKNSAGNVVSGSCYSQGPGYGPWGNIIIPLTITLTPDCYTVTLTFQATASSSSQTVTYTAGVWDCTQTNGGNACLAELGPSSTGSGSSSSDAARVDSWVELLY